MTTTPEELVTIILGLVGVILQLALMYVPKLSDWYQNNPNKGLLALVFAGVLGGIYFGLSCTPFAIDLKIALSCTKDGLFVLLRAIFIIAVSQQTFYGYTKPIVKKRFSLK